MSKDIFNKHKGLDVIYKASDGTAFYTENNAKNHANKLKNKAVEKVTRAEAMKGVKEETGGDSDMKLSAEQRIEVIQGLKTVKDVEEALKGEKASTVKAAGKARIEELGRVDKVNSLETIEAVNEALENEKSEEVLAAGKAKIEQLNQA